MGGCVHSIFYNIISIDNLLLAWKKFKKNKLSKASVQEFEYNLESNILKLHSDLKQGAYKPIAYVPFYVYDPKKRYIHKAEVIDRVVHQAVINIIEPIFDKRFIHDSFSCRKNKGTHAGVKRLRSFLNKASLNNTREIWILKCDVKKFFDSINHNILKDILYKQIKCTETQNLINIIVDSFEKSSKTGLPLGNLTSQFFGNVYLHELDFYIKHTLKIKYYVRYCDDVVLVSSNKLELEKWLESITKFLKQKLLLTMHPNKIYFKKYTQGIDFLGYVIFPNYSILRKTTKKRIIKKWSNLNNSQKASYNGVLKHCKSFKIKTLLTSIS